MSSCSNNISIHNVCLYSKADYEAINKEIKNTDWTKEYNNKYVTEMWRHFKQYYRQLVVRHAPFKHIKQGLSLTRPRERYKSVQKANKE